MKNLIRRFMKPPAAPGNINARERPLTVLIATFFYIGYIPYAPGTCGSLATIIIAYFVLPPDIPLQVFICAAVLIIGAFISKRAEDIYGKDGGPIVIDETAGMLVTLIGIPKSFILYVIAFFLFRMFDIVKPYPARRSEKIPYGWGVMADDIFAGLYGLITLHVIIYVYQLSF